MTPVADEVDADVATAGGADGGRDGKRADSPLPSALRGLSVPLFISRISLASLI